MKKFLWIIVGCSLFASSANAADIMVPFVGCPADGQAGVLAPPAGNAVKVHVDSPPPVPLAYYKGEQSGGVFAPAGWHCRVWYGSSGSFMIVAPGSIKPPFFPPPSFAGPVVEYSFAIGGTSGRFEVARLGGMLFPALTRKFVKSVEQEEEMMGMKSSRKKKYRTDSLTYLSPHIVQFLTPAYAEGLGTEGQLKATSHPIQGFVALGLSEGDPPDISVFRIRLDAKDEAVESYILKLNAGCFNQPA